MRSRRLTIASVALAIGIALIANRPALAGGPDDLRNWKVADDQEIGDTRGGLVSGDGLEFALGIEKFIYVNGILEATNTLNIVKDANGVPQLAPGQPVGNMLTLVQIGDPAKNTFDPGNLSSGFFTVVQNNLDQQTIKNIDKITTTISVLPLLRAINQEAVLNQGLIKSLR
ncbi:MAG: hypothetical protein ACXWWV_09225 [Candidatus Deferrimicrobiaceae bacterium]